SGMRRLGRIGGWVTAGALGRGGGPGAAPGSAGGPKPPPPPHFAAKRPAPPPTIVPAGRPESLEPDRRSLPTTDPATDSTARATRAGLTFRALTEDRCRALAVLHAPLADPL